MHSLSKSKVNIIALAYASNLALKFEQLTLGLERLIGSILEKYVVYKT